ncbi:MAG: DUF1801 domain-containing protein [Acidimicrobiia bacterium]|nr:DUF1801 domain-containing protein [Acidimicrobiia bacterium]
MERTDHDIAEFLDGLPDGVRDDMRTLHDVIADVMDGMPAWLYTGKFWGGTDQDIIGYGQMDYSRPDGTEVQWFVVGLAAQKNHLSIYVNVVEDRQYLSEKYGKALGKVKVGKASVGFKGVADIDLDELRGFLGRAREVYEADS